MIPVYTGRPAYVPDPDNPGWVDCVAVHDTEYLRQRSEWRQKVFSAHPDRGGTNRRLQRVTTDRAAWKAAEAAWYAERGLQPPSPPKAMLGAVRDIRLNLVRGRGTTRQRIVAYLLSHPAAGNREVASALGLNVKAVATMRCRMRKQPISTEPNGPERVLALLSDGRPYSRQQCAVIAETDGSHISACFRRLRQRGYDIVRVSRGRESAYQLLSATG